MHAVSIAVETWYDVAQRQAGMLSQRQLHEVRVRRAFVRNQLRAQRWIQVSSSVYSTTTGPLSRDQQLWRAVLHAGPAALVGGLTAAEQHGLDRWGREEITVIVDDELSFDPLPGVRFFRSRRPLPAMRGPGVLPLCLIEPAILLFAGYERNRRTAHGAVIATVQQRLTTPDRLGTWVDLLRPLRRAREFRSLLSDIGVGVHSLAERDLRRACTRSGVVPPRSQTPRHDRTGRQRYTDAEWDLPDGRVLVLEVDGAFHDDARQASADKARARRLTTSRRIVVACTAHELRYDADSVMADLVALGVPRLG